MRQSQQRFVLNICLAMFSLFMSFWVMRNLGINHSIVQLPDGSFQVVDRRHMTLKELRRSMFLNILALSVKFFGSVTGVSLALKSIFALQWKLNVPHWLVMMLPFLSIVSFVAGLYAFYYGRNDRTELVKLDERTRHALLACSSILFVIAFGCAVAFGVGIHIGG